MRKSELISSTHLARKAIIYVRQSTPHQVMNNKESLQIQYALQERALSLGWEAEKIEVVDADLGVSASSIESRQGFKEVLTQVMLGQVGIVLSSEVTRLSRNCTDWYPLLDACAYRGCLIADRDGIYDPSSTNGRLLLGLKGQISELELHTIRARLTSGLMNKAARGELIIPLPSGLIRSEGGVVQKHPSREVQRRIELIFQKFLELRSAEKVAKHLRQHELLIPRVAAEKEHVWRKATSAAIRGFLKNPAYAGVYAFGKKQTIATGPSSKASRRVPQKNWRVCLQDKYPPYINWATYEKIQKMLADNHAEYRWKRSRGVPRNGQALLQGIAHCGQCGHKMELMYKSTSRYICNSSRKQTGDAPVCQRIPMGPVDGHVSEAFFRAISPLEINLLSKVMAARRRAFAGIEQAKQDQLERFKYQERLAKRQYDRVDPENRLVAAELEMGWERALAELRQAEQEYEETLKLHSPVDEAVLSQEVRESFRKIGETLPDLWKRKHLLQEQKKALLRTMIDQVMLRRSKRDIVEVRILWKGGESTLIDVPITVGSIAELSNHQSLQTKILELAKHGMSDFEITQTLEKQGYRSPLKKDQLLRSTVTSIRLKHRLIQPKHYKSKRKFNGFLTVPQLASQLGVYDYWIRDRIYNGSIQIKLNQQKDQYLFPDSPETRKKINQLKNGRVKKIEILGG